MTPRSTLLPVSRLRATRTSLDDPDVAAAWQELQRDGHIDTPFLSWQWFSALRDVPELAAAIEIIACRRPDGTIAGLYPLEIVRLGVLRVAGIAGWQWAGPDHVDVVAAPDERDAVARAVLTELARGGWDVLNLDGLRPDAALATAAAEVLRRPRFLVRPTTPVNVNYVRLTGPVLSTHGRKQVRKELRRAEESGGGFSVVTDPQRFPALLDTMMELHQRRFGARSRVFSTEPRRRFHQLAAQRLGADGLVRIHELRVGDEAAAITYTLGWKGSLLFYSGGLRTDIGMTPGFSIRAAAMNAAAEDGYAEVDLLRGDHGYKDRFSTEVRPDLQVRVIRLTPRTVAEGTRRGVLAAARKARGLAEQLRRRGGKEASS